MLKDEAKKKKNKTTTTTRMKMRTKELNGMDLQK